MPYIAKVTYHFAIGRQGWNEFHYFVQAGDFSDWTTTVDRATAVAAARRELLGNNCVLDYINASLVSPEDVAGGYTLPPGKQLMFIRKSIPFTYAQASGPGNNASAAEDPWTVALCRLFSAPGSIYNRSFGMRGMPAAYLPYNTGNPAAPNFPPNQFLPKLNALAAAMQMNPSGTSPWGMMVREFSSTVPARFFIKNVIVDPNDRSRTFQYQIVGLPNTVHVGDLVHIANVRGPGLTGASGETRIVSITGTAPNFFVATNLQQKEDCLVVFTPGIAYLRQVQFTFKSYGSLNWERTSERLTGRPNVATRGRKRKKMNGQLQWVPQ